MNNKLKPCPFCGGEAGVYIVSLRKKPHRYYVRCKQNSSDFPTCWFRPISKWVHTINGRVEDFETEEQAIQAWNTRVEPKGLDVEEVMKVIDDTNKMVYKIYKRDASLGELSTAICQTFKPKGLDEGEVEKFVEENTICNDGYACIRKLEDGYGIKHFSKAICQTFKPDGIVLNGHIEKETDFWITVHLPNSGMIIDLMKKDLSKTFKPKVDVDRLIEIIIKSPLCNYHKGMTSVVQNMMDEDMEKLKKEIADHLNKGENNG